VGATSYIGLRTVVFDLACSSQIAGIMVAYVTRKSGRDGMPALLRPTARVRPDRDK